MTPKQIQELRESRQMTQEEFARLLGFQSQQARSYISRLESGERRPNGPLLVLLQLLSQQQTTRRR